MEAHEHKQKQTDFKCCLLFISSVAHTINEIIFAYFPTLVEIIIPGALNHLLTSCGIRTHKMDYEIMC